MGKNGLSCEEQLQLDNLKAKASRYKRDAKTRAYLENAKHEIEALRKAGEYENPIRAWSSGKRA